MIFLRSLLFQVLFYLSNALQMIFWTPAYFFMPRHQAWKIVRLWAKSHLWLQHVVVGSRFEFRGFTLSRLFNHSIEISIETVIDSLHVSAFHIALCFG